MELKLIETVSLKKKLSEWKPQTKADAIQLIHFLSTVNAADKDLKEKAYAFLDNRCADCDVHEAGGLTVRKVEVAKTLFLEDTPQIVEMTTQIKNLQEELKVLKELNKSSVKEVTHYYKKI